MEYTTLGETGLEVSRLILGTAHFGDDEWGIGAEDAHDVVDAALEAGINTIDTANVYAGGRSEEIVGEAIEGRRDELVVATKVRSRMADRPNGAGLSKKHVLEQAERSLERLGTDYIDLYQIHAWDDSTPVRETLEALDHLVQEGAVRYIGASNTAGWQLMKALRESDLRGLERFVAIQPEYSLVARDEEYNMLPVAEDQGLGVVPWSPLGAGFLSGRYDRDTDLTAVGGDDWWRDLSVFDTEERWAVVDAAREIATEANATLPQVALAWLLERDAVTAPIVGPRSPAELEECVGALDVALSDAQVERLEEPHDPAWSG